MRKPSGWLLWVMTSAVLLFACGMASAQSGPTVVSVVLSPSTIAGGSGGVSTGTVTLSGLAPAGGTRVALSSSNTGLAASRPSVLVPEGAASATFTVATNRLYRRYSGLAFTATIGAAANGSSASATLTVTAQPRPADIDSDSSQRSGSMCGGSFPASGGEHGILYSCVKAPNFGSTGKCTFKQECLTFGCQTRQASGFTFNDACATSGPFPVAIAPAYLESGNAAAGTIFLASPAPSGSDVSVLSANPQTTAFPTGFFSIPTGATSIGFRVATSILPSIDFASVRANLEIPVPISGGGTFIGHRLGLTWLAMTPPDNPPPQPVQTLGWLHVDLTPVNGGSASNASVWLSAVSPSGGPTIALASSNPQAASVPPSVTIPAGSNVENVTIATQPVTSTTTVTLTATEGPRSVSDTITVLAASCTPTTCAAQGKNCGSIPDGCGGTLGCGTCVAPQTCVSNVCTTSCTPTTCAAQGKNCGTISDGCAGTLSCGTCAAPQTCGGGGTPNVCGTSGSCGAGASSVTLTVTGQSGSVTSSPSGLSVSAGGMGSACFQNNTQVELQATRSANWSGVTCDRGNSNQDKCRFTLGTSAVSVTANLVSRR